MLRGAILTNKIYILFNSFLLTKLACNTHIQFKSIRLARLLSMCSTSFDTRSYSSRANRIGINRRSHQLRIISLDKSET